MAAIGVLRKVCAQTWRPASMRADALEMCRRGSHRKTLQEKEEENGGKPWFYLFYPKFCSSYEVLKHQRICLEGGWKIGCSPGGLKTSPPCAPYEFAKVGYVNVFDFKSGLLQRLVTFYVSGFFSKNTTHVFLFPHSIESIAGRKLFFLRSSFPSTVYHSP